MVRPIIKYNASSGSASASGAGPGTAVTGTNASASASTTVQLDGGTDLSGVTPHTDALMIAGSGGGLFRITAVNDGADQVTIHTAVTVSGASWAIGGTRSNPRADANFADEDTGEAGWTYEFANGTYDCGTDSFQFPAGDTTEGHTVIRGAAGSSSVLLTSTGNMHVILTRSYQHFQNFNVEPDGNRYGVYVDTSSHHVKFSSVNFDAATQGAYNCVLVNIESSLTFVDCDFYGGTSQAFSHSSGRGALVFLGCVFRQSVDGLRLAGGQSYGDDILIDGCVFRDNSASGLITAGSQWPAIFIKNSVFHDNGQDGIEFTSTAANAGMFVRNCIFTENGGYGYNNASGTSHDEKLDVDYCAYRNNTSGARNNLTAGANDVTLTADPYTSESTDDYTLNSTAGGGAACRDAGIPASVGSSTPLNINIGIAQDTPGASSTPIYHSRPRRIM